MARMKSSAPRANIFNSLAQVKVPQSRFNLSYDNKFTTNIGELMPFMCKRIVPGDKFNVGSGVFLRFMPLISPVMHSIDCEIRYFYVPNRIIWPDFDEHITGGEIVHPVIEWKQEEDGDYDAFYRLADMLNVNIHANSLDAGQTHYPYINVLPFLAYNKIWNWYFRQQFIQDELYDEFNPETMNNVQIIDEAAGVFGIKKVDWRKDYFTSALPFTQLGESAKVSEEVYLKDVKYGSDEQLIKTWVNKGTELAPEYKLQKGYGDPTVYPPFLRTMKDSGDGVGADGRLGIYESNTNNVTPKVAYFDPNGTLQVEFPIERLREANALQRFLEKSALGGNRISEFYLNHFGVYVSDTRLQIPQYLGGGRMPVTISEIAQTSETSETPQGTLAGKGVASGSVQFKHPYIFKEYGWLIGVFFIRPKASYCQGTPKQMWMESQSRFDNYYFPEFCHLGEEAVRNYEIFGTTRDSTALAPFGYQSRNADYKYYQDEVHGDLKGNLAFWTLARQFNDQPNLNDEFLTCNASDDIFAVEETNSDNIIVDVYSFIDAQRPMTQYGTPALVVE